MDRATATVMVSVLAILGTQIDAAGELIDVPSACTGSGNSLECRFAELGQRDVGHYALGIETAQACTDGLPVPIALIARVQNDAQAGVPDAVPSDNEATLNVLPIDTTPPSINQLTASPFVLWPATRTLRPVIIRATAADACDPAPQCAITGVTSNHDPLLLRDWWITGNTVWLRAERAPFGRTRTYTISVECHDHSTNSSTRTVGVIVPGLWD